MKIIKLVQSSLIILPLIILYSRFYSSQKYKIVQYIAHNDKTKQIVENFKPQKIPDKKTNKKNAQQLKKITYQRKEFVYDYDEHDKFYYDTLIDQKNTKRPILILCFMGGHSKSQAIRRSARGFFQAGHNCYILLPRGSMGLKIDPQQKKFRSEGYDTEDINQLINIIKSEQKCEKVDVVAYSLGCLQILGYLVSKESNVLSVNNVFLNFCYHYPETFPKTKRFYQKRLSSFLPKQLLENKQYYMNHGITEQQIQQIVQKVDIVLFDKLIWCPRTNCKTVEEYYYMRGFENKLDKINQQTTLYFFNTQDDFLTRNQHQIELLNKTSNVNFILFNKGNHLGTVTQEGDDLTTRLAVQLDED